MPFYALISLLDTLCCFAFAFLLIIRSHRQSEILSFLVYAVGLWMALPWIAYMVPDINPLLLARCFYGPAVCTPSLVLLFALVTLERRIREPSFYLTLFLGIGFIALLAHPLFIQGVRQTSEGVWIIPGPVFFAFAAYFACVGLYAIGLLVIAYHAHSTAHRNRLKWITAAFLCAGVGGALYFVSVATGQFLGHHFFMIGFALAIGYAVLWRRLYEVELATRNAASTPNRASAAGPRTALRPTPA